MRLFEEADRPTVEALARLVHTNPFSRDWVKLEREVLGEAFEEAPDVYSRQAHWHEGHLHPNVIHTSERVKGLVERARERLAGGGISDEEKRLYQNLAFYHLYGEHDEPMIHAARVACRGHSPMMGEAWNQFQESYQFCFPAGQRFPMPFEPKRLFALFFQIRRAFLQIYDHIVGDSEPAAELRAAVWHSIFTHDLYRYYRWLSDRMQEFPTLITGASGTGKELVARAIGRSQYIPFCFETKRFEAAFDQLFFAVNLSALAATLIESAVFGHIKGAFTGAVKNRKGWLELCDPHGTVFLDEIGEVDPEIQVKLLRVLETRDFERLGECKQRRFSGRLLAATNRDLTAAMQTGHFRPDLYYRLCTVQIRTPTLREQLDARPEDLRNLVAFIARKLFADPTGPDVPAPTRAAARSPKAHPGPIGDIAEPVNELTDEVVVWIQQNQPHYSWPGNFRELGHCVRSILIRHSYEAPGLQPSPNGDPAEELARDVAARRLTDDELRQRYFRLVYDDSATLQAAADRLEVNWRTLKRVMRGEE